MASSRVNLVCIGNELHGDDGVGAAVWARLADAPLPAGVRLMRVPFAGLAAVGCFEDCARVVVVDALRGFGAPGTVHRLPADAIAEEARVGHAAGLGELLPTLPLLLDTVPPIEVVGIEAARFDAFRPGLSAVVAAAVPTAGRLALEAAGG